jgi:hypothetical protein
VQPTRSVIHFAGLLAALTAAACGGDSAAVPESGSLEVTAATTGPEPDPDGYTVQVDDGPSQTIGPSATIQNTGLSPGDHAVQLGGIAANCTVSGANPRTVAVAASQTASVNFAVTCSATSGGILVTTSTSGTPSDPDGYSVTVDGADRGAIAVSGQVNLGQLPAGAHQIGLNGVAANCQVGGTNPQTVTVVSGQSATVAFAVTCSAPPVTVGTLRVRTVTTGQVDPDGYTFAVDNAANQTIGANATTTVANVAGGAHSILLSGLASNCTVQGTNPRPVTVAAGATATVTFTVACASLGVRWTAMASGTDSDFWGVSGRGPADVFAVGRHYVPIPGGKESDYSVILHFDGQRWSEQHQEPGVQLSDVWADLRGEAYAVGSAGAGGAILYYDGGAWTRMTDGPINDVTFINAVWGNSASDVFAVGTVASPSVEGRILHYDGESWSRMPTPDLTDVRLEAVWGRSASDVYVAGWAPAGSTDRASVFHYDGRQWTEVHSELVDPGNADNGMWVSPDGHVFVSLASGVLRYDGTSWSLMRLTLGFGGGVWGSTSTDVYTTRSADILHYDGATWTPTPVAGAQRMMDVWGSSATDVFAVGFQGFIMHGTR